MPMISHHSKTTYSSCSTTGVLWSRTGIQSCKWHIWPWKKRELCNPNKKTNIESTAHMLDIVSVGMPQMTKEIVDTRKDTLRNLSKSGDLRSWEHSTKEDNFNKRVCYAINDQSESTLGRTTRGIEVGGMINIPRDAAQIDARRNGFWSGPITARRGKKNSAIVAKGTFHQFCDEIQDCLIDVGVEDSHEQDTINNRELGYQQRSKR